MLKDPVTQYSVTKVKTHAVVPVRLDGVPDGQAKSWRPRTKKKFWCRVPSGPSDPAHSSAARRLPGPCWSAATYTMWVVANRSLPGVVRVLSLGPIYDTRRGGAQPPPPGPRPCRQATSNSRAPSTTQVVPPANNPPNPHKWSVEEPE